MDDAAQRSRGLTGDPVPCAFEICRVVSVDRNRLGRRRGQSGQWKNQDRFLAARRETRRETSADSSAVCENHPRAVWRLGRGRSAFRARPGHLGPLDVIEPVGPSRLSADRSGVAILGRLTRRQLLAERLPTRRGEPIPFALPRIRRKFHASSRGAVERRPIDRAPGGVHAAESRQHRRALGAVAIERMEHAVRTAFADRLGNHGAQHGVRTDLQKHRLIAECFVDGGAKKHRLPNVAAPVTCVEVEACARRAGDGRDHRDASSGRRQPCERRLELSRVRLHLIAVKRIVDGDRLNEHVLLPQHVGELIDRGRLARHDGGAASVDGRDRDASVERRSRALRLARRQFDGQHLSEAGGLLHDAAAIHGDPCCVGERQRAGDMRGCDLAGAVADHCRWRDPPGLPQRREPDLQREQQRLGVFGLIEPR